MMMVVYGAPESQNRNSIGQWFCAAGRITSACCDFTGREVNRDYLRLDQVSSAQPAWIIPIPSL